ncbi:MAG: hypothetical protein WBO29_11040 [Albidovulum sp.]
MTTIDLSAFDDDGFVLHFGGRTHEVDALTFGNALVSIAEAVRAINQEVNPGFALEIAIDAVGPGSFRARLKTAKKTLKNLFSLDIRRDVVIPILCALLYDKVINPDQPPQIIVNDYSVIIEHGADRIIVPRDAYEAKKKVEASPAVNRHIAKAMEVMENDPSVESFGIATGLRDPEPLVEFPRSKFPVIRQNAMPRPEEGSRYEDKDVVVSVHKAVFERSTRKWEFIWNGFKISAPILDQTFFDRLEARTVAIKQGDAFKAVLRIHQTYDKMSGNWINERYEIITVGDLIAQSPHQLSVGFSDS